jgi:hypothetical protein
MLDKVTLYIATHNITGLKYFGKTTRFFTREDLQKQYHGSGVHWKRHLKKHGDDVTMEIFRICSLNEDNIDFITPIAISFSMDFDIVRSDLWANAKIEDGFEGGSLPGELNPCFGLVKSEETRLKLSKAHKGKKFSDEHKLNISESNKGKKLSEETKAKISITSSAENNGFYGQTHTEETKEKLRGPKSEETKLKLSESQKEKLICPFCLLEGGKSAMRRWHFENCKFKQIQTT